MSRLAEELDLERSTVTRLVDELVKSGYAERADDPKDRRTVMVRLSPSGLGKVAEIDVAWNAFFARALSRMDDSDRDSFTRSLPRFLAALRAETVGNKGACKC
jgi:DNA-binding MarR family transcriptional regulator